MMVTTFVHYINMASPRHKNNIVNLANASNNENNISILNNTIEQLWNTVLELKIKISELEKSNIQMKRDIANLS